MKCYPISEGAFTVNESKKFVPFNKAVDSIKNYSGSLLVEICPFLIVSDNALIVIDPGLGMKNETGEFQIIKNISALGFNSTDINLVLLSHLHKDHSGGIAYEESGEMKALFPNADYVYQKQEMEEALSKATLNSYEENKLLFLKNRNKKIVLNGNTQLNKNIYCELSGGHTKYHQVFWLEDETDKFFFGGDVLPQASQLIRRFTAKYDFDGKKSADLRMQYGKKCADENRVLLFFHDSINATSKVKQENGRFELLQNY